MIIFDTKRLRNREIYFLKPFHLADRNAFYFKGNITFGNNRSR